MYLRLLFLVLIIAAVLLLVRWFVRTPPERVVRVVRAAGLTSIIALLLFLGVTGRLHWLLAVIGSLLGAAAPLMRRGLPWLVRFLPLLSGLAARMRKARAAQGPAPGGQSRVETSLLRMTLDHDSGEMDGEVLAGRFVGRRLGQMSLDELLEFLHECRRADRDAADLLQAYLDRVHGEAWHEGGQEQADAAGARDRAEPRGGMTPEEAAEVLGLAPGASESEIIEAHRRLMQKLHPDRGGSTYLAAKLNQAKAVLMG